MLKVAFKHTFTYGLSSILSKGMTFILLPVYTYSMSPAAYGAYDLLITFGVLCNLIVCLEISQGVARHWIETPTKKARQNLASTALWFAVVMYSIFLILCFTLERELVQYAISESRYEEEFKLGVLLIVCNGIYLLLLNQFRWELKSRTYATISIINAGLMLAFSLTFCLALDQGLKGAITAHIYSAFVCCLICLWKQRKLYKISFDKRQLFSMLRFSIPLVPSSIAIFITLYVNRFILTQYGTLADVGQFSANIRVSSIVLLMFAGIQYALTPLIYKNYSLPSTRSELSRMFNWVFAMGLFTCLSLSYFAPEVFSQLTSAEYEINSTIVGILSLSLFLSQLYIFSPGIPLEKRTTLQFAITTFSAVVSIVSSIILTPLMGIPGAALSMLLSSFSYLTVWAIFSQKLYKIPFEWGKIIGMLSTFLCFQLTVTAFIEIQYSGYFVLIFKVALLIAFLYASLKLKAFSQEDLISLKLNFNQRFNLKK